MSRTKSLVVVAGMVMFASAGCDKSDASKSAPAVTAAPEPTQAPASPSAPAASAAAAPSAAGSAPVASASAPAVSAPTTTAGAHADAGKVEAKTDAGTSTKAAAKTAATSITGKNYTLAVASSGCHVGDECTMRLNLVAQGEYHVNKEYPYKFVGTPAAGVTFLGKGDANTFTRAAGDFKELGEKEAAMTVRFRASAPGEAKLSGTYKMSVCSAEQCQIEQQAVALSVPVE